MQTFTQEQSKKIYQDAKSKGLDAKKVIYLMAKDGAVFDGVDMNGILSYGKQNYEPKEAPKQSFVQDVKSAVQERNQNVQDIQGMREQGQSVVGEVLNTVAPSVSEKVSPLLEKIQKLKSKVATPNVAQLGQSAGLVNDILGAGLSAITPDAVKKFGTEAIQKVVPDVLAQAGLNTIEDYNAWAEKNPLTAKNIEGAVNIASLLPTAKAGQIAGTAAKEGLEQGVKQVLESGAKTVGNIAGKAKTVTGKVFPTEEQSILEIVTPELSTKKAGQAIKSGRGKVETGTIFDTVTITPDSKITKAFEATKDIINPNATITENTNIVREALGTEAEALKAKIQDVPSIFTFKELNSALNNVELPISFKADAQSKVLKKVTSAAMNIAKKQKGKLGGLLDARKEFDRLVEENFPNLYEAGKPTPAYNAITKTRNALNDFIETKLPDGFGYKESLRKQSAFYDALDAMESKAAKEVGTPTNKVIRKAKQIMKNNPKATSIAKITAGGLTAAGVGKSLLGN